MSKSNLKNKIARKEVSEKTKAKQISEIKTLDPVGLKSFRKM